ncbi:hypothetical protein ILUMI_10792 [Ignelater luminosus]|uniref:Uncharacterized protein n=1 Tax=Ignelater luminosus TaxID=2038154 RepID=A0A8K0G8C4_IGNLU|nr:hypothetical protein ILUMI_10792 [Ignelater luminosus]
MACCSPGEGVTVGILTSTNDDPTQPQPSTCNNVPINQHLTTPQPSTSQGTASTPATNDNVWLSTCKSEASSGFKIFPTMMKMRIRQTIDKERQKFYDTFQYLLNTFPTNERTIIVEDLNTRIVDKIIPGIKERQPRNDKPGRQELLCALNELRINNTFYDHHSQQKVTFANTRGQSSMIDYFITNKTIHP